MHTSYRKNPMLVLTLALGCSWPWSTRASTTFGDFDFYFGDAHVHGPASGDGCASDTGPSWNQDSACGAYGTDGATLASSATGNGMDWIFMTDHVNGSGDSSGTNGASIKDADGGDTYWRDGCDDAFTMSTSTFLAFCGAEVWYTQSGGTKHGHYTVVMFGTSSELSTLTRNDMSPTGLNHNTSGTNSSDVANCVAIDTHLDAIQAEVTDGDGTVDVLALRHHGAATAPMPTNFGCHHSSYTVAYEINSQHGNSDLKHATPNPDGSFYNPLLLPDLSGNVTNTGTWTYYDVNYGTDSTRRMGLFAGTDYHKTRAGNVCPSEGPDPSDNYGGSITAVMLDTGASYTREAIRDAFMARKTYGSTGPKVPMVVTVYDSTGATWKGDMGDVISISGTTTLQFEVDIPDGGTEDWEAEVVDVEVVKGNTCGSGTCTQTRTSLSETSAGHWEGDISMSDPDSAWIEVELSGTDSHPSGCDDGGTGDEEWLYSSPTYTN